MDRRPLRWHRSGGLPTKSFWTRRLVECRAIEGEPYARSIIHDFESISQRHAANAPFAERFVGNPEPAGNLLDEVPLVQHGSRILDKSSDKSRGRQPVGLKNRTDRPKSVDGAAGIKIR